MFNFSRSNELPSFPANDHEWSTSKTEEVPSTKVDSKQVDAGTEYSLPLNHNYLPEEVTAEFDTDSRELTVDAKGHDGINYMSQKNTLRFSTDIPADNVKVQVKGKTLIVTVLAFKKDRKPKVLIPVT